MLTKRILTMQDLSCVGQCSLTVALPILSRFGIETCVLPTAILSNHTQFNGWSYLDLTNEIRNIFDHWEQSEISFDAFLLGYLGKKELMALAEECFRRFSNANSPVIIDPVFADDGKLYSGFDLEYVEEMAKLISKADVIDPNVTEACFLTNTPYAARHDTPFAKKLAEKLAAQTNADIVITGVEENGMIGELILQKGEFSDAMLPKLPCRYHGTGDIFSSVLTANLLNGKTLRDSCFAAGQFVADCMRNTDQTHFYGVNFESVLSK